MDLTESVRKIKNVGAKRGNCLESRKIYSIGDILNQFPIKYLDRNNMGDLLNPTESNVTVLLRVSKKGTVRRIRKNLSLFVLPVTSEDGQLKAEIVWFNQPYLAKSFELNSSYYFYGKIIKKDRIQIYNPDYVNANEIGSFFELTPVYSHIPGIPKTFIPRIVENILKTEQVTIDDFFPHKILKKYNLCNLHDAYEKIHSPQTMEEVSIGQKRFKYDEGIKLNLGILNNRKQSIPNTLLSNFEKIEQFIMRLPFTLTTSQIEVVEKIKEELESGILINRLIQGDVGSGKTILAIIFSYFFAINGYQTAYMAPTEILAEQHARNFKMMLDTYGITTILLKGQMTEKLKNELLENVSLGKSQVIIGTHALIQKKTEFYNLGLVITDEQHRFGVNQRGKLTLKGELPHTLVMSATPIPRTLSLILYGDLSVSYLNELPKGRKRIKTYFYREKYLPQIFDFIEKEVKKGHQAYVVCPFVAESEELPNTKDVEQVYKDLKKYFNNVCIIDYLHGKMSSDEKNIKLNKFHKKESDVLVATSIVEVGIDNENATVMVILSAERFGLSQLHQIRGRVGRSSLQSYCFLVSNICNEKSLERMRVIVENTDGRKIADEDLRLRGSGDYFGTRQHGLPALSILNPMQDIEILKETQKIAIEIFNSNEEEMMKYRGNCIASFENETAEIALT